MQRLAEAKLKAEQGIMWRDEMRSEVWGLDVQGLEAVGWCFRQCRAAGSTPKWRSPDPIVSRLWWAWQTNMSVAEVVVGCHFPTGGVEQRQDGVIQRIQQDLDAIVCVGLEEHREVVECSPGGNRVARGWPT